MVYADVAEHRRQERLSERLIDISEGDDAYGGYCAKGVANILEGLGVSCTRNHAHTWKDTLPKNGWELIHVRPEDAPVGSVIVYDRSPGSKGAGGGKEFGHVEIVAEKDGERRYVSDKARKNWGGTVPQNLVGVYVHPKLMGEGADLDAIQNELNRNRDDALSLDARLGVSDSGMSDIFNFAQQDPDVTGMLRMLVQFIEGMFGTNTFAAAQPEPDVTPAVDIQIDPVVTSNDPLVRTTIV